MEELSMSLFGDLPGSISITGITTTSSESSTTHKTNNNMYTFPNNDTKHVSPPISPSSTISFRNTNTNTTFHIHQQTIIADTISWITTRSCGHELQKDKIVIEKLHEVVNMLYNAIVGGEEFLNKCEINKQKNSKQKWNINTGPNGFQYLSLKDARNIASNIMGCDVNKWNREEERRLCFELSLIKLYSYHPECKTMFCNTNEELLHSYPEFEDIQYENEEMSKLLSFRNFMKLACCTMAAHNNKGHLLDLVTRLCEGSPEVVKYITGSGEKPTTRRRVLIYEREGEVSKISRPERSISIRKDEKLNKSHAHLSKINSSSKKGVTHSNRSSHKVSHEVKHSLSLRDPSKMSPSHGCLDEDGTPRSGFDILVDVVAQESMVLIDSIAKEQNESPPTPSINDINPPDFKHTFGVSGETFAQHLPPPSLLRFTSLGIIEKDFQNQDSLGALDKNTNFDKGLGLSLSTNAMIPFVTGYSQEFSPRSEFSPTSMLTPKLGLPLSP